MNERFKRFERRTDNAKDIISAQDHNLLAETLETEQRERFRSQDIDFSSKALFALEHHLEVNTLRIDELTDDSGIDKTLSTTIFDVETRAVMLEASAYTGAFYSKPYATKDEVTVDKAMLMVSEHKPSETSIFYEISSNGIDWYPITPNSSNVINLANNGTNVTVRATINRNSLDQHPRIDALAILYVDPALKFIPSQS